MEGKSRYFSPEMAWKKPGDVHSASTACNTQWLKDQKVAFGRGYLEKGRHFDDEEFRETLAETYASRCTGADGLLFTLAIILLK